MNPKILVVSIYPELTEMFEAASKELEIPISIYNGGMMNDGHLYAKKMEKEFNVIISQGGTLEVIKNIVSIPVVSVEVKVADVLSAILTAKEEYSNKKIVLFSYKNEELNKLRNFKNMLNVDFEVVNYGNKEEYIDQTKKISTKKDSVLVRMSDHKIQNLKENQIDSVIIKSSEKAVKQSLIDAANICNLNIMEKMKAERLKAIIDYSASAIINIDEKGVVETFNPVAERIFELKSEYVLGKSIFELNHFIESDLIYGDGKRKTEEIIKINSIELILNRVPIIVENQEKGLIITLQEITKIQSLERNVRNKLYNKGFVARYNFEDISGVSKSIKETIDDAIKFSKTSATILIRGETGTGKEMFAQSIHNASNRKDKPFVAVNCAALTESLLESQLFGYEEGAFTGAKKGGKIGLFELAHEGTIFLDEIAEIPLSFQNRLLRVLQEKEILRIGGEEIIKVDVRVIVATNVNLYKKVSENKFRIDLFFRLNILKIRIPPINERREDIPSLVEEFINVFNIKYEKNIKSITPNAMELLMDYNWAGNVREIENFVERMTILSDYEIVEESIIEKMFEQSFSEDFGDEDSSGEFDGRDGFVEIKIDTMKNMELQIIEELNNKFKGNKAMLAGKLGISRTTLWKKIKELEESEN